MVADKLSLNQTFAYVIWWSQFECKEACTLESITILGWDVNVKPMQDLDLSTICVASFIICESPNWKVRKSSSELSKLVISMEHQSLDLALKSTIVTVRNGLLHNNVSRINFRFDLNVWNLSCFWLGDLKRWMKRQTLLPMLISKVIHSLRYEIFKTLRSTNLEGRLVL